MKKRLTAILLCLLTAMNLQMPIIAYATTKAMQMTDSSNPTGGISGYASNTYHYIYYGSFENNPVKWRVLDTNTNTGSSDGMFLLSEYTYGTGEFGNIAFNNTLNNKYRESNVLNWCQNFKQNNFTNEEQNSIITTTKDDAEVFIEFSGQQVKYFAYDKILENDYIFLPSAQEMNNSTYGFSSDDKRKADYIRNNSISWYWLRSRLHNHSANNSTDWVGTVNIHGQIGPNRSNHTTVVRPAFNLNKASILFTSSADNGKQSGSVGQNALTQVQNNAGTEWKLTLRDTSRNFLISDCKKTGSVISFNYQGAKSGANEYVSAIITDAGNNIKYYGRIAQGLSHGNGKVDITGKMEASDKLYVFSEQYNGNKKTDYASTLQEAVPDTTPPALTAGTATRINQTNATVKFTSNEAGHYYYKVQDTNEADPTSINTATSGTACDTTEQTIALNNLTDEKAKNIYIVVKDKADNVSNMLKIKIPKYAVYHTVRFESNNGTAHIEQRIEKGKKITSPPQPTKANHTFKGWFKDNNTFNNPFSFDTAINSDITLYAKWKKVPSNNPGGTPGGSGGGASTPNTTTQPHINIPPLPNDKANSKEYKISINEKKPIKLKSGDIIIGPRGVPYHNQYFTFKLKKTQKVTFKLSGARTSLSINKKQKKSNTTLLGLKKEGMASFELKKGTYYVTLNTLGYYTKNKEYKLEFQIQDLKLK